MKMVFKLAKKTKTLRKLKIFSNLKFSRIRRFRRIRRKLLSLKKMLKFKLFSYKKNIRFFVKEAKKFAWSLIILNFSKIFFFLKKLQFIVRFFYGNIKEKKLRRIHRLFWKEKGNFWNKLPHNYFNFIDRKLLNMAYRTKFFFKPKLFIQMIRHGKIFFEIYSFFYKKMSKIGDSFNVSLKINEALVIPQNLFFSYFRSIIVLNHLCIIYKNSLFFFNFFYFFKDLKKRFLFKFFFKVNFLEKFFLKFFLCFNKKFLIKKFLIKKFLIKKF